MILREGRPEAGTRARSDGEEHARFGGFFEDAAIAPEEGARKQQALVSCAAIEKAADADG